MKHLFRKGWFAGLALAASPALAQEIRQVGNFQPIATLTRPAPLVGATPQDPGTVLDFRTVTLDRPTPLVRGKIEIDAPRPLPPGAPSIDVVGPAGTQPPAGIPMVNVQQPEFVPPQPKAVQPMPGGNPVVVYPSSPGGSYVVPGTTIYSSDGIVDDGCGCSTGCSTGVPGRRLARNFWTRNLANDACGCTTEPAAAACGCGDGCLPRPTRFWVRGEYLLWSFSGGTIPALVTTSSNGLPANFANPTTSILFNQLDNPLRSGAQFTIGGWFPNNDDWGLEGSFMFIGQRNSSFNASSNGTPTLTMPYFDVGKAAGPNAQSGENEAVPGIIAGRININYYTTMTGFEVNLRRKLDCGDRFWVDGLLGFRYINLEDSIVMSRNFTVSPPGVAPANFDIFDSFRTTNQFFGGQVGVDGEYKLMDRLSLRGSFKLGLGMMNQGIDIDGASTQAIANAGVTRQTGGVYALTTNIGHHTRNVFTVVPELGLRLNYDLTDNLRLYAGYSALYIPQVVRAGQQIDTVVNSNFIPFVRNNPAVAPFANTGPQRPAVLFNSTGLWAHGVNFGLEYHY